MGIDQKSAQSVPMTSATAHRNGILAPRVRANIEYNAPIRLNTRGINDSDCQSYTQEQSIKYGIKEDGQEPKTKSETKRKRRAGGNLDIDVIDNHRGSIHDDAGFSKPVFTSANMEPIQIYPPNTIKQSYWQRNELLKD